MLDKTRTVQSAVAPLAFIHVGNGRWWYGYVVLPQRPHLLMKPQHVSALDAYYNDTLIEGMSS